MTRRLQNLRKGLGTNPAIRRTLGERRQNLRSVPVQHRNRRLRDDGAYIDIMPDKVNGAAMNANSRRQGLFMGVKTFERGQQ